MKTDNPIVIIIGNNNKVPSSEGKGFLPKAIVILAIAIVVLAVSLCCPDLCANFIRWIISIKVG